MDHRTLTAALPVPVLILTGAAPAEATFSSNSRAIRRPR